MQQNELGRHLEMQNASLNHQNSAIRMQVYDHGSPWCDWQAILLGTWEGAGELSLGARGM